MKLMKVDEYREKHYTKASRPTRRKLINMIKTGFLPGRKEGKYYYVDIDAALRKTGNPLVDRVFGT
jgi:hypothetical protein